ncbi:MAG: hypothetical protein H6Q72_928 [Firmicutes bacterium]|nr:hypothetical protein [Bacillota bacterium]
MWQQWQEAMLLEADRLGVPLWAIAYEFSKSVGECENRLALLKWRGAA